MSDPKPKAYWAIRSMLGDLMVCDVDMECPMLFSSEKKARSFAKSTGDPFLEPCRVYLTPLKPGGAI